MKIIASIILVCLIGVAWIFSSALPFGNEITVYPVFCMGQYVDDACTGEVQAGNRTTYKIFVEQQTVVHWDETEKEVHRFPYCAVRDVKNWTCQYDPPTGENRPRDVAIDGAVNFVGGRFSVKTSFGNVPKWKWWRAKLFNK